MNHKCFVLLLLLFCSACVSSNKTDEAETLIRKIMARQEISWNEGDIRGFMQGYWPSDSLMFIGKDGITYGYRQTLERYQKNYPDAAAMGTLSFHILEMERLSPDTYHMVGQWRLDRQADQLKGHFTLLFKKIDGEWLIVKDHSS
jgi:ketosteroid isomerase-like protein